MSAFFWNFEGVIRNEFVPEGRSVDSTAPSYERGFREEISPSCDE